MLKLRKKQIKPISLMLSRAFQDELKDIFPDPEERNMKMPYVYELHLLYEFSNSEAFITSSELEGIAVWTHSDRWGKVSLWRILTSGIIRPVIKIGFKALKKMWALNKYVESKHKELVPDKHWYLALLAVAPEHQGKGYASQLLSEMLASIDQEGLPCYLETDGEKNAFMYQHFGFKVVDEFIVPGTTDKIITMIRKPKNGQQ